MTCIRGDFEGSWDVVAGARQGTRLELEKVRERHYRIHDGDAGSLDEELALDATTFTFKSTSVCLSLWKDCDHLFAAERATDDVMVWAARRCREPDCREPGDDDTARSPIPPDWQPKSTWTVVATSGPPPVPPVEPEDRLTIEHDELDRFKIFRNRDAEPFDLLVLNETNRTLDGLAVDRCIALWQAKEDGRDAIFAMIRLPAESRRLLESLSPSSASEPITKRLGLHRFEIDMLLRMPPLDDGGSIGVWGAEEG